MSELERELRGLAAAVEFPPAPDLASRVRAAVERPRRSLWPRWVAVAVAAAAVAAGAAFAVPQARSAILRFFGIGSVRIEFVEKLPEVRRGPLELGKQIDADDAPFALLRSKLLGRPDTVYREGDNVVTLLYGTPRDVRLLLTQIQGSGFDSTVGKKLLAEGTDASFVDIRGAPGPGVWIHGRPHVVEFPGGPVRLAANTLIFERGGLTVRIEGGLGVEQARRIAESLTR